MQLKNIGKAITAGALATVMATATIGFATTLADYPAPFVSDGTVPTIIAVGADALPSDVVGAIDMAARLGAEPGEEKTVTCSGCAGTTGVVAVSGGVQLTSDMNKTYVGQQYDTVKATLTSTDLPELLATQTFTDKNSTSINYAQQIVLGNQTVTYGTPSAETEPNLYSQFGSSYPYVLKVIFQGGLDTSAVDSNYKITLFGKEYTFGSTHTNTSLELYSSTGATTTTLSGVGDTTTVTVGGSDYTFELKGYSGTTIAYFFVNGQQTDTYGWTEGNTYNVGGIKVYVSDVSVVKTGAQEESVSAKLFVGTDKLELVTGQAVEKNDVALVNTLTTFSSSGSKINTLTIKSAPDVDTYVIDGGEFVDPVFGSFKFTVNGMHPAVKSAARDYIKVGKDGTNKIKLTFTNKEGTEYAVPVFYYDTSTWERTIDGTHQIHIQEGANIDAGDYFVLSNAANKATYVYKMASAPYTGATPYVTLTDVATGSSQKIYYASDPYLRIGENTFKIVNVSSTEIDVDLDGSGAVGTNYVNIFTKGEAVVNLTIGVGDPTANLTITETPLYTVSGSNEPTARSILVTGSYSASDVAFSAPSATGLAGGQIGSQNKYRYVTQYGTYMERDTDTDAIEVYYPGNRPSYALVAVGDDPVWSTSEGTTGTGSSTTTYEAVKPITTSIAKLDTEVTSADKTAKNLILVGGPCVNDLVAELATAGKLKLDGEALTCSAWNAKSAAGDKFGLIQVIDDAFATGKAALVVAGSTATETRQATSALQDYVAKGLTGTAVKIKNNVITPVTVG